jgi:hypothetical protein
MAIQKRLVKDLYNGKIACDTTPKRITQVSQYCSVVDEWTNDTMEADNLE